MVSKPEMDEEEAAAAAEAFCVVRDFSGTSQNVKISLNVSSTMTGKEFVQEVAKRYNFEPSSFRLVSPTPNKMNDSYQAVLTEESEELLKDVGVMFEENSRNLFIVEGLNGGGPRLLNKEDDLELGASASPEEPSSSNSYSPPLPPPLMIQQQQDVHNVSFEYSGANKARRNRAYRGLVNQAMTCYLNSLLQALFMTPEFRNALYNWKFIPSSDTDESKSIPYQLQRLFLNLQTSPRTAVETTDLTRSFGWDSSEAWQQHDIQELCRVMFDALEHEFKGTEQADLINRLYQGKMTDYVKCLDCGTEKSREDTFLDIPLPVRPFGSTTAYGSVEEALQAFVQPEVLEGNDQYFCEKCDKKCNAHKGLKFIKFPYLLTLHLMRFDFDYNTMHRIKLSDKVVFPETLNLNSFVPLVNLTTPNMYKEDGSEGFPEEITGSSGKCDDSSTTDSGSAIDDETCMTSSNDLNNVDYDQDIDEGIDVSNQHENENKNPGMETGPYFYELFSIMVHSGSASGGHYYVYIKDFNTGEWVCFNDQTVTKITTEDIDRSFGGYGGPSRGYYSGVYSSSMNAYMLMYRQMDRERNVLPLKEHEFPPHITALLKELNEKAETDRRIRECEKEVHKMKVHIFHPTLNKDLDCKVEYSANTTIRELTQIAFKKLQLENIVSLDQCRLVVYNKQTDVVENCLDGKENDRIESLLFTSSRKIELLMEVRSPNESFLTYKPGAVPVKVLLVDLETSRVLDAVNVRTSLSNFLPAFKEELFEYKTFRCYRSSLMLMILQMKCQAPKFLEDETITLQMHGVEANSTVFVSFVSDSETSLSACRQKMRLIFRRFFSMLKLNITLPCTEPDEFKILSIPTLAEFYNACNDVDTKQCENYQLEKDTCHMNGDSNVGESTQPSNEEDTSSTLMGEFMNALPCSIAVHRSDQSASEDSSLTDSDRTIIGGNPDEYQIPSPSISPQSHDIRYTNDSCGEDEISVENTNANKTSLVPIISDGSSKVEPENYDFEVLTEELARSQKCLVINVDKSIPIIDFKKRLEPYVQIPYPYFECVQNWVENGEDVSLSGNVISSLKNLEEGSTLQIRLAYPSKPGTLRGRLHLFNPANDKYVLEPLDKFNIEESSTVGDTKRKLLQDLRIIRKMDLPDKRCLIRIMSSGSPGKICLDEQTWKELGLENNWKLIVQVSDYEIDLSKARYCVLLRSHKASLNFVGPLRQIFFSDKFSLADLKTKISEMSEVPTENLIVGEQLWSDATTADSRSLHTQVTIMNVDWQTLNQLSDPDEVLRRLTEDGRIIHYKDDRDDSLDKKPDFKEHRYVRRNSTKFKSSSHALPKKEKTLTIRVSKSNKVSNSDEGDSNSSDITKIPSHKYSDALNFYRTKST